MAAQPISSVEKGLVIFACVVVDTIGLIPVLGNIADIVGIFSLNLYFLIKLGSRYFGGQRSSQKIANTLINGMIGVMPVIGNFVPELTIQAVTMFWILDQEIKDAEEKAAQAASKKPRLSRAA